MTELEIMQLRREMIPATAPLAEHEPGLPGANQQPNAALFNFDFSFTPQNIPQLPPQPQHSQFYHRQQPQLRLTPPLPTPVTPDSSSSVVLIASPPATPPNQMAFRRESSDSSSFGTKHTSEEATSSTSTPTSAKKPRQCMSVKDFVPPDVTGLSKREARLVKNRAAAFLSRQRKREEFEMMEMYVYLTKL